MNKRLIFTASLFLGFIVTIVIYFSIGAILLPFKEVSIFLLCLYIFLIILIQSIHTLRWKIILRTMNHNLLFRKLFIFRIIGYSLNYITPTAHIGGEPLKAAMLKESKVPYSEGVSSIFIDKSLEVLADGFFVLIGVMIVLLSFALPKEEIVNLIIVSSICVMTVIGIFFNLLKKKNSLYLTYKFLKLDKINFLKKMDKDIKKTGDNIQYFFNHNKQAFFVSLVLSFSMWIFMFLEYKVLFLMLGFNANIFQLFIIISFVGLAYIIPVPAAIGVLEVGQLSAFSLLNLSSSLGIAASIVIRAKDSIITLIGLLIISFKGFWKFK